MYKSLLGVSILFTVCVNAPASAATLQANAATLSAVFKAAKAGDTIVLNGDFGRTKLSDRTFATAVRIDASKANFSDTLLVTNVAGLVLIGGKYGSSTAATSYNKAILVYGSKNITVSGATVVGNKAGIGIGVQSSDRVKVTSSSFTALHAGVTFTAVTNSAITNNKSIGAASDGFDIADSHTVTVSGNRCTGSAPVPGAHPDCVQLWSVKGNPVQSDITVSSNTAIGQTQGFTSFTPDNGGGLRIKIINNRVDTSFPQGIACYGCVDSTITGNVLTTQAGSKYMTKLTIAGGSNNVVANNSQAPYSPVKTPVTATASRTASFTVASIFTDASGDELPDDMLGSRDFTGFDSDVTSARGLANDGVDTLQSAIPEPASWTMMVSGFALAGGCMRRRRLQPA